MPVVVTGASGLIGRHAVTGFLNVSPQVRAYVRRPEAAEDLRKLGANAAVGDIFDVDHLVDVMSGAHTVCHLIGGLELPSDEAFRRVNLESTEAAVAAAIRAGVRRVLFVSYPGASPDSRNVFLRCKGMAEEVIRASSLEHVIIRSVHVYAPESRAIRGTGKEVVAPVFVKDLVAVLAAADDRERVVSGVWGLEGPDRLTVDEYAALITGRPIGTKHLKAARASRWNDITSKRGSEHPASFEIWTSDSLADSPDAAAEFGVDRTSLAEGLAQAIAEAAPLSLEGPLARLSRRIRLRRAD
jgi:NADH dehydrogenase